MQESLTNLPVAFASSFTLVVLAEIGDKSQLVCMTLAARYRGWPVFLGAMTAFAILNLLAVMFGAAAARWLPGQVLAVLVGGLFLLFGLHAIRAANDSESEPVDEPRGGHGILVSTFLLIMLAEFGDKTQIAVAGLGSTLSPVAVWLGATLALAMTTGAGVWAGRTLLQRIPMGMLHRFSGVFFILLGLLALASLWR